MPGLAQESDSAAQAQRFLDSLRLTQPATAGGWYRKSISLTKEVAPLYPAGNQVEELVADRDEELAAVLGGRENASESLYLLKDANLMAFGRKSSAQAPVSHNIDWAS